MLLQASVFLKVQLNMYHSQNFLTYSVLIYKFNSYKYAIFFSLFNKTHYLQWNTFFSFFPNERGKREKYSEDFPISKVSKVLSNMLKLYFHLYKITYIIYTLLLIFTYNNVLFIKISAKSRWCNRWRAIKKQHSWNTSFKTKENDGNS